MINVSNNFQSNVDEGRTKVLLRMGNAIFDNADIASGGLHVTESLGPEESYTIGNAPAGTISFDLLNEDGRFSNLNWGELRAVGYATSGVWIGYSAGSSYVLVANSVYGSTPNPGWLACTTGNQLWSSLGVATLPSNDGLLFMSVYVGRVFILAKSGNDTVLFLCYAGDGTWQSTDGFLWSDLTESWTTLANFNTRVLSSDYQDDNIKKRLKRRSEELAYGQSICGESIIGDTFYDCALSDGWRYYMSWEGCPIGVYDIERPEQTSGKTIHCEGLGIMARLDNIEMDNYSGMFPTTGNKLLDKICADAGIKKTADVHNIITGYLNAWEGYTARDFVKEYCTITGKNAIVDRTGNLIFRHVSATNKSFSESNYSAVDISEISTTQVTGVSIKNSNSDVGVFYGTTDEPYTIVENKLLGAMSVSLRQNLANSIYSWVHNIPAYHPLTADLWAGWQYEVGDKVTIVRDGVSYLIPIFNIEYTITSGCRATISVTGKEHRNDVAEVNREQYKSNQKRYELSKTVDGLLSAVYDEQGYSRIEQTAGLISACVTKTGGDASSFGWELTSTDWSLKSNGTEVLKVDSSGLTINGNGKFSGELVAATGTFSGTLSAASGSFNGEVTCTSLIVGGQTFTPASVQTAISQAYNNYGTWNGTSGTVSSSSGYWNSGGGFAGNCWGTNYTVKTVDADYLRMPYGRATVVCTISPVVINGGTYYIPCVTPG